jgi:CRISPR/Cas system-associated exonuclease Cas4 (RecB family)
MNKVICSATNNEVTMDFCKNCALNAPAPCGWDYSLIKKAHAAVQGREGVHVTDLVHCLRRAYYEEIQPVPERVSDVLYRIIGTATHSLLEAGEDDNLITELPLEYKGVVGTVDAYYPDTKTIVDYKTTRWLKKAYLPYGDHEMQVNIYRWLLKGNGYEVDRMFLHYIDLSGPSKCRSCKVPLIEEGGIFLCPVCGKPNKNGHHGTALVEVPMEVLSDIDEYVMTRKEILESAVESKEAPEGEPGFLCNYCQFKDICPDSDARV